MFAYCLNMISRKENDFMKSKKYEWAKKEIGKLDADEKKLNKTVLKLAKKICKANPSLLATRFIKRRFNRIVEGLPLTPITEDNAEWEEVEPNKWQSKRYSALFKYVSEDGTVTYTDVGRRKWDLGDDKILDELFPIKLPYYPSLEKYYVESEIWLCKDDTDVIGIHYIITPEMEYIPVNKYYWDVNGERKEITKEEFDERRKW